MDGLFALGSNGSGQLGLGHKEDVSVPKQVEFDQTPRDDPVTQITTGGNHTVLVTASGKAYWSGDYSSGCCGIIENEDDKPEIRPRFREFCLSRSKTTGRVMYAACTWDNTVLVVADEDGRARQVYSCGTLGAADGEPVLIPDFPPMGTVVVDLAAGFRHVIAVLDTGEAYGWGNGKKGQLGELDNNDADTGGIVTRPQKVNGVLFRVAKAVCCQYATCFIAEPGDGRIFVLGADKWQLKSQAPSAIPSWKTMVASWGSVYILKRDGTLVAWGRNDHGQLPPPGLKELSHVVAGSEHVVALTEAGDVLSWGWGEHGNCGPKTDGKFGDVKGRWNIMASLKNLPEGSSITAIGAGCATTWINIMAEGIFL